MLALVALFVLAGRGTESPARRNAPRTPAGSPTSEQPASVAEAFAALTAIVNKGLEDGVISEKAAEELFKGLQEINEKWITGDAEEALAKIGDLDLKVDELAQAGEITAPQVVEALHGGLDDLAEVMGSTAPPEVEEGQGNGGNGGNGNGGNGKGKGKGKNGD